MNTKASYRLFLLIFISGIFFSCQEPTTHGEPPYLGPPKEIISVEQAREMYNAYSERRVPIIKQYEQGISEDTTDFEPTRYAEYDLDVVKQYIAYIEHQAKEADVEIKTLRFYLSNYPDSDKFSTGEAVKYPRKNTFFVVPTMDHNGQNVGFYLENLEGRNAAKPLTEYAAQRSNEQNKTQTDSTAVMNEAGFFMTNKSANQKGGTTSVILNDGQVSPPPGANDFGNDN